jgi:hypothetical protein
LSVNSGNILLLLEPSGTVQTCRRIVLPFTSRSEEYLDNEIKIVKAISKDINMNFGFKKVPKYF